MQPAVETKAQLAQFVAETFLVCRLQQSRTQVAVNFDGSAQ